MRYTHTIGPATLDRVCVHRDLRDGEAELLAKAIGTALHVFEPHIGQWASAYFLGQVLHESGELRFTRELWGPTSGQANYWRRRDLQGDGKLEPWMGFHYRGGGFIQTTGRANYRSAARLLRSKGIKAPSAFWLAAHSHEIGHAALLAAAWWAPRFPVDMSGSEWDAERVTRVVNGGTNGLEERRMYTRACLQHRRFLDPEPI